MTRPHFATATVPDAMIVIDELGSILSFSAAAEKMFGWRAPEVVGKRIDEVKVVCSGAGAAAGIAIGTCATCAGLGGEHRRYGDARNGHGGSKGGALHESAEDSVSCTIFRCRAGKPKSVFLSPVSVTL